MSGLKQLYHGTTPEALPYIQTKGIQPSRFDGLIYMSVSRSEALMFTSFSKGMKYERDDNGQVISATRHRYLYVIEIDAHMLNKKLLEPGTDHNPMFFKEPVFCYPGVIPPTAFIDTWQFDMELLNEAT